MNTTTFANRGSHLCPGALARERPAPPALPENYYSASAAALQAFARRAANESTPNLVAAFPTIGAMEPGDAPWRPSGERLYRGWIRLIANGADDDCRQAGWRLEGQRNGLP